MIILVTGATGHVGRAVVCKLASLGHDVVAMVRDVQVASRRLPAGIALRIADYDDASALKEAFADIDDLVLISSDGDASAVMRHHANAMDAAAAAGIARIVFTSIVDVEPGSPFYFAPVYRDAERRLAASGIASTIVRCGLYSDFVLEHWLKPGAKSGEVLLAAGQGLVAPISRDDVATAIVAIASQPGMRRPLYVITGHQALTLEAIVAAFGEVAGLPIRYSDASISDYLAWARAHLDDPWPDAFSSLCASIDEGRYGRVSNDFAELVGQKPESLSQFLRRAVWAGSSSPR
ncbi:NmrA family NAD(P)-binding protein [Mesorhizobium sp. AR10]|uniref:NAD(P)H-binding protein n=1 Tax=Mesorhizobium sp. AR10 TaxID=2865839 RepID=UPI00215E21A6|nr:NAD(P)H-binding protein [Mesorhizobium sp. AR10]UVK39393.1 NmrA family NAD(P)-binding protein [Mesorhizobium sp. AR10]